MNNDTRDLKEILYSNFNLEEYLLSMMKSMMESLMKAELTELLKYEKYSYEGHHSGNSRNGFYTRDYETKYGKINDLKIPRDRNGEFEQQLIPPYQRRDCWLEDMIINMYAKGMATREIAALIERLYGNSYSAGTISNITDVALEEVKKWHDRPLSKRYSVLFIDALSIKLRRDTVSNDSVYFIMGINEEGYREILDFFIGTNESAYVWEEQLQSLKKRGVVEVLLGVMDGLSGIEDAFGRVFPKADIQSCVVHKVRNSIKNIRKKDISAFTTDLKAVYESPRLDVAKMALDDLVMKWGKIYPRVVDSWIKSDHLFTYFNYPESIRKAIYTTNWIERFNKEVRRVTKTKDSFPNEEACEKLIYFKVTAYNSTWASKKLRGFLTAYDDLQEMFQQRYS